MTALRTNLFVVALTLSLLGNVMVYSATSKEYGTHYLVVRFAHLAVGVLSFLLVKQVRYTSWRKIAPGFYLLVLAMWGRPVCSRRSLRSWQRSSCSPAR
jgi:cell division protein FtsW (lipid II flippase)